MIFCIEDDAAIRDIEVYALRSAGFETEGIPDGLAGWETLKKTTPELVILDVMLPGLDGVALLRKMKEEPTLREVPVIMATAKGTEYDKIQSLDLGADDYLVKPFGVLELVSRVKAVLRRCQKKTVSRVLESGGLAMHLDEHIVTVHGSRVSLTYKEYELLRMFMTHPGMAYTREQIFEQVWETDYIGDSRTLDMHIRTLRQKLGDQGRRIETVRNVGYRLEAAE